MKFKYFFIFVIFQCIFLFTAFQCGGNLSLTNGYEYDVIVHTSYIYNNIIIERSDNYYSGMVFFVDAKGHSRFSNIK